MKRPTLILILILFLITVLSCSQDLTKTEKMEKLLKKFSDYLIEKNVFADCKDGYKYLLEAIQLAAVDAQLPDEFANHITQASQIFKKTSIFNPEGVGLLHKAYAVAHDGEGFKVPAGIVYGKDAEDYSRKSVQAAIKAFKENQPERTIKLLVELAIMIVTPIQENPASVKIVY